MNRGGGGGYRGGRGGGRHNAFRGRSSQSTERYVARCSQVGSRSDEPAVAHRSESSKIGGRSSEVAAVDGLSKKLNGMLPSDYLHGSNSDARGVVSISSSDGNPKQVQNVPIAEGQTPKSLSTHCELNARTSKMIQSRNQDEDNYSQSHCPPVVDVTHKLKEPCHTVGSGFHYCKFSQVVESGRSTADGTSSKGGLENSDSLLKGFDICEERNINVPKLKPPQHIKNKAIRNEMKHHTEGNNIQILKPGMFLLKGYISLIDQVKLIKSCRNLGRGIGGFYQPGYRDGAKLHLKMMCLGKNWDPETSMYGDERPIDEAKPPPIPDEFQILVKRAIQECHSYLESHSKERNARNILPSMSPNICIINFYTKTGKLGLHQDKDESPESLDKRLPVVSFSIGDSAEFLFGDHRDIDKADKVELKSGDVLIFGGESRLIFHGVSTIIPDTAPKVLLEETDFKPGRLNLTFREY